MGRSNPDGRSAHNGTTRRPSRRAALTGLAAAALTPVVAGSALGAAGRSPAARTADPDLGPHVHVFDPSTPASEIQAALDSAFSTQERNQFGTERVAFLFKPGTYTGVDANVGFYTHVAGLGLSPDDVVLEDSHVRVEADWFDGNATQNFWRAAENFHLVPRDGTNRWAVSQAAPLRRVHVSGDMTLWNGYDGWSSGGFLADSRVEGAVVSGSQQQWLTRNSTLGEWEGSVWNMVFVGVEGAPPHHFPDPSHTVVDAAPVLREKPFLHVDGAGAWQVFVPATRTDSAGTSWSGGTAAGESLPLEDFHIAREGDTAADLNAALDAGKHLLVTPGVYEIEEPVRLTRDGTVVLGIGLATFVPQGGVTALTVGDVEGTTVAGILVDAGTTNSETLMEVGTGSGGGSASRPTALHDVFFRIGGAHAGKATTSLVVNSPHTIGDNLWLWRGDHGSGIGWETNTAETGLVVEADDVTMYGLFVEHYQKTEVEWNGERGRTYFFQNEFPYDPPDQSSWSDGGTNGYPAYRVAEDVTSHEAWGLGSYCNFTDDESVVAERSFVAPEGPGIDFTDMVIVSLGGKGTINHVINDLGGPAGPTENDGIFYLTGNH